MLRIVKNKKKVTALSISIFVLEEEVDGGFLEMAARSVSRLKMVVTSSPQIFLRSNRYVNSHSVFYSSFDADSYAECIDADYIAMRHLFGLKL